MESKAQVRFKLGDTRHGQTVELVREYDGTFTIIKHAAGQRDETDTIRNIDDSMIRKILETYQFIKQHNI